MYTLNSTAALTDNSRQPIELTMDCCAAAGYTGRNQESVKAHITELKRLGVPTPYATPAIYWISPARLTAKETVTVVGEETSPEVEFFIASAADSQLYVTVASDHTDRKLESVSVGKSKQVCDKILGDTFWKVSEIADHWDQIELFSRVMDGSEWVEYQRGTLKDILPYTELFKMISEDEPAGKTPGLLSGTIPVLGGDVIYTNRCEITLSDPVLKRDISKQYTINVLPDRS